VSQNDQRRHVTDEELLLDYYGESLPEQRDEMRVHLETCEACRAMERELRGVLALVDTEPMPAAPPGFEREMWARLEPHVASGSSRNVVSGFSRTRTRRSWTFDSPRWSLAAAAAVLAVVSFTLGRVWAPSPASTSSPASLADARNLGERLLRSEVEEHLERSQRMLVELANADDSSPVVLASGRDQAADLVAAGRLYRRTAEEMGDADTRDLLEAVERVLVEVANGPALETSNDLNSVRARISDQDLIFRLRLMTAALRAREQRELAGSW
jgi:hypothetical protein